MPDKDPATAAAEAAAKELVKVAYGDLLQPAARVVGTEFGEFVQAIVVAGRGFGYLIRERYQPFVLRAIQRVSEERRVPPRPELLGPILEGLTYQREGSEVAEMFEALLAAEMDSGRAGQCHPAFAHTLRQITSEQARAIRIAKEYGEVTAVQFADPSTGSRQEVCGTGQSADLASNNLEFELAHLVEIGIFEPPPISSVDMTEDFQGRPHETLTYELSYVGIAFAAACLPHR
jgi:hypothetical protein